MGVSWGLEVEAGFGGRDDEGAGAVYGCSFGKFPLWNGGVWTERIGRPQASEQGRGCTWEGGEEVRKASARREPHLCGVGFALTLLTFPGGHCGQRVRWRQTGGLDLAGTHQVRCRRWRGCMESECLGVTEREWEGNSLSAPLCSL